MTALVVADDPMTGEKCCDIVPNAEIGAQRIDQHDCRLSAVAA